MPNDVECPPERTTIALVNGILIDLQHLVEQQLQLTRRELEQEIRKRSSAAMVLAVGIGVLFLGAMVTCMTLVHLMHWMTSPLGMELAWLPLWACHAIIAAALGIIAGILIYIGRTRLRSVDKMQCLAIDVLQENVPWTTNRK